jgi:hypothetical protein
LPRKWTAGRDREFYQHLHQHNRGLHNSLPPSSGPSRIRLPLPQEYDGTAANCQGFLLQLDLYLATIHPAPSGRERVSSLVSSLTGKALEWANAVWREGDAALDQFEEFSLRF